MRMPHYLIALRVSAIAIALVNVFSLFALDLREWLVYFDPAAFYVLVLPAFVVGLPALLFLIPCHQSPASTNRLMAGLLFLTVVLVIFEALWLWQIIVATYFRGPFWTFYWPWEQRMPKLVPLGSINFSELFWISWLGRDRRPANALIREAPGIAWLAVHFVGVPVIAAVITRWIRSPLQTWRVVAIALALQLLSFTVVKIVVDFLGNLNYVVAWPEKMLNI